ncbi:dihydrolipoyl dehydrogenase [Achromobacter sp. ES-001]|uniref:dihydrolipoyl dehydrogenase n=1 Tax=Achromobacter sp. ES-001 TaxID=2860286 RepID=UPI001C63BCDD|nr:dihydrolipoyl dehydrogenase [Achromobacter sp. ES-001]QYJ21165.1 dihydrolipoyl dehydrogenase [Achromobacter sp. ES-001]
MTKNVFDVVVVGGGPGGYVAAIRAAQLGMSVALVERAELGGICLNWGCIPTKALLHSATVLRACQEASHYGVTGTGEARADLAAMVARSRKVAGRLGQGVAHLMKKNGVTVYAARAQLAGAGTLALDNGATLSAKHIILATGARARELPALPLGDRIWAYRQALAPTQIPKTLLVVGAGAIGAEFASFYRAIGSDVTLIDMTPEILPQEDAEISQLARKAFEKQGIRVLTQCAVTASSPSAMGVNVTLEQQGKKTQLEVDRVIVAAGIVGNVEDLGLEKTRVQVEKTHIVTDAHCRTGEPGVYAIGDVAGAPWLAHKASHEGVLCVEAIAGKTVHAIDPLRIPACTYSYPQVASIGMTEARAREHAKAHGGEIRVGKFTFAGNGKAIAMGEDQGLVKTVFDATSGELLGAHIIHPEASELITGYGVAASLEATEEDLMHTVFAHPTLSETLHESVLAAFGRALHA